MGGNREGVAQANLSTQQAAAQNPIIAGLYSNSYNQGVATAAQQYQQNPLAAAGSLANFGISGQGAALSGAGAQLGAGTLQQQTQQQADTANYGQYAQAQAYPYQQTQWLAGIDTGVGSQLGGTSQGQTTAPPPNQTAQYLGLGIAGASLLSDWDAKEARQRVGKLNDGTPIYRFRYKGSPDWHVGPMAQDVEKSNPDAVSRGIDGYRYLDLKEATDGSVRKASGGGVGYADGGGAGEMEQNAGSPYQILTNGGQHQVINVRTGQIHYTGTASGASNAQATLNSRRFASGGGVSGTPWGDAQGWIPQMQIHGGAGAPHASAPGVAAQPAFDPMKFAQGIAGLGKGVSFGDGFTVPGGSSTANSLNDYLQDQELEGQGGASIGSYFARGGGVAGYADGGAPDFDERFAPAIDAPFGEMPRGHGIALAARDRSLLAPTVGDNGPVPVFGPDGKMMGNQTSAQGVVPAPEAPPIAAKDDDEEELPPNATPTQGAPPGVGSGVYKPPYQITPEDYAPTKPSQSSGWGLGLISPNAQSGLLAAGLGMLASRSPNLGNAVGEGALAGASVYGTAQERDRQSEEAARKLSLEAKKAANAEAHTAFTTNETTRHNLATEKQASINSDRTKFIPAGSLMTKDGNLHPLVMEQTTGKLIDGVTRKPPTDEDKIAQKDSKGPINEDDAKSIAEYYVKTGDNSRLNGLGITSSARQAVQKHIREVMEREKVTPEEMGTRVAEFAGRKAGQRVLATQEAKMGSAAFEAEGAIKQARGVIEKLPRTSFLPFNQLIQGYSKNTLNPDQAELYARAQAIVNTYSAVMARGANVTTDSSRHHAEALLNTAGDPATFNRTLDTMLQEIEMAKHSPAKMREFYRQQYGPKAATDEPAPGGAPAATTPAAAAPVTKVINGVTYVNRNGQWFAQ